MPAAWLSQVLSDGLQVAQQLSQFSSLTIIFSRSVLAIDKLHRDEVSAFALTNLVDVGDVRMIERSCRFRFADEPSMRSRFAATAAGKTFRATLRSSLCLVPIHLTHPALADL